MDDDQKELLKVGAETAMKPFADLINKLFGGPVEAIGGMWTDGLMARREIRKIKLFKKVQLAIEEAGFEPQAIPDKIWVPAVHAALLEDDETLQDAWASLLANASDPRSEKAEYVLFPSILKELTSREVKFLDIIFKERISWFNRYFEFAMTIRDLLEYYKRAGLLKHSRFLVGLAAKEDFMDEEFQNDRHDFNLMLSLLFRNGLIQNDLQRQSVDPGKLIEALTNNEGTPDRLPLNGTPYYVLTKLGAVFLAACQRPAKSLSSLGSSNSCLFSG